MASGASDPLIAALLDKLPAAGERWPAAARQAWMQMLEMSFAVVYPDAGSQPMRLVPQRPVPLNSAATAVRTAKVKKAKARKAKKPTRPTVPKPVAAGPAFFIDKEHFARRRGGDRIMPADVADMLVDLRGESGDLGKITWADGSQGIPKGMQLDITTSV